VSIRAKPDGSDVNFSNVHYEPGGNWGSVGAFVDDSRVASNAGKFNIARYGWQLFARSPAWGYGRRRFEELTIPLGNDIPSQYQTHSFVLSIVLASGLVGFLAWVATLGVIGRGLLRGHDGPSLVMFAFLVGISVYDVIYDAGGLDLFAWFNGLIAYYAFSLAPSRAARDGSE